MFVDIIKVFL